MKLNKQMKLEIINILKMKKLIGMNHIQPISVSMKKVENKILPNTINNLEEYVHNCFLCTLSKSNKIFAKGNPLSSVYIVGLNYNYDEETEFLLLKKMIENVIHISIGDTCMTNILKCKSNKIQNNLDNEVQKCIPYLEQQISISKPSLIITLGKAFSYMMNTTEQNTDVYGSLFSYNSIDLVPLMDPNFIYKNPSYKEKMYSDLKKIKKIMDEK